MIQTRFTSVTVKEKIQTWMIDSTQCMTPNEATTDDDVWHGSERLLKMKVKIRWMSGGVEASFILTGLLNVSRLHSLLAVSLMLSSSFTFYVASILSLTVHLIFIQPEVHVCLYVW